MADNSVPPVFRSALDEPAPPDPPEVEPEDDGDDSGHHIHMIHPVVMVLSNGAVQTTGSGGTLLTAVVIANALIVAWLGWSWLRTSVTAFDVALMLVTLLVAFGGACAGLIVTTGLSNLWGWWRKRRATRKAGRP